jgi:hypothetical protein
MHSSSTQHVLPLLVTTGCTTLSNNSASTSMLQSASRMARLLISASWPSLAGLHSWSAQVAANGRSRHKARALDH